MKYLKHYTGILNMLMLLTVLSFTSCGGDNDGDENGLFFNVTVSSTEGGVAKVSKTSIEAGGIVKLTAIPDDGYKFLCWTLNGAIVSTENPYSAVITNNYNYVANFVTSEIEGNGLNNGYEYVDLGLSVKWATCNIGAASPEDYGDYFAWGETSSKTSYNWQTYKYCKGSYYTLTKYCKNSTSGIVDNKTRLELEDDVARVKWESTWRMPTLEEFKELKENCTWTWTTQNNVNGYKVESKKNGNYIFLPAAGYIEDRSYYFRGVNGVYWSSSHGTGYESRSACMIIYTEGFSFNHHGREQGLSVRAVCE